MKQLFLFAALLCCLFFALPQARATIPPNLVEFYSGPGAAEVPGTTRVPNSYTDVIANHFLGTEFDAIDTSFFITSLTTNLGEYNCQIFSGQVNEVDPSSCLDREVAFSYWGLEGGVAYTNSMNVSFVAPTPDLFLSIYNPLTDKYEVLGTFNTSGNTTGSPGNLVNEINWNDTRGYDSPYFYLNQNGTCVVTYAACGLVFSDTSTPLVYSWQGETEGYKYLGELGVGYLTPLPRSWESSPNYFAASPVWPDASYVFPSSAFVAVEREGQSVWEMQYCEEKEEFSFTDSIELSFVDVPTGVSIYPDFHLTPTLFGIDNSEIVDISSCIDQDGRDCLSQLSSFDKNEWVTSSEPGVTPSFVEFGLGVTSSSSIPSNLKLLLSMRFFKNFKTWRMYPHTSRRSIELQQFDAPSNGWVPVPSPYSLSEKGDNNMIYNTTDFDRNTRIVDLSGMTFTQNEGEELKLRLAFYWQDLPIKVDRIQLHLKEGYTVPSPTVLTPVSADLHFRGVSVNNRAAAANLISAPSYSPVYEVGLPLDMSGDLTAYGDVLSLLTSKDDEYVIMGTGDEMTLRFAAPSTGPAEGMSRHVVFASRCWYKAEGKATGRTVAPLPYFSMPKYPYNPATDAYDTAAHAAFLAGNTRSYEAEVEHFSLWTNFIQFSQTNVTGPAMNSNANTVAPMLGAVLLAVVSLLLAFIMQ